MNIDTMNYSHYRVTTHKDGSQTVMETRDGTVANMCRKLADIIACAHNRASIIEALALQHSPI